MTDVSTSETRRAAAVAPTEPPAAAPAPQSRCSSRGALLVALLVIGAAVASLAPFLWRFEFSNGGENMVVASVQEMHRGGPWFVPTLHEEVRTKKPPLATWMSAFAARPATTAKFNDPDPAVRDRAFSDFGWQVRWPALLAMAGVLLATYVLGTQVGGPRLGLLSVIVCASSLFWLRNARLATTDVHLALWVSVANCLFAHAVLNRGLWLGLAAGGAALGLAMMSKGPVALVQSVVPVLAFLAWRRYRGGGAAGAINAGADAGARATGAATRPTRSWRAVLPPLATGLALFAVVGLSWYAIVIAKRPDVLDEWRREVTREGATNLEPSKPYAYVYLLGHMMPWTFFFIAGLIGAGTLAVRGVPRDLPRGAGEPGAGERGGRVALAFLLVVVPILVMSLFRDREIRYLIPLLAPSSVVAAWGLIEFTAAAKRGLATTLAVAGLHWLPLLVAGVGLPLAASPLGSLKAFDGGPWYSLRFAIIAAEVVAVLVVVAVVLQRRWGAWAIAGGTCAVMLLWNVVFNLGYMKYREGRSEMRPLAERILQSQPHATVYSFRPDRPIRHAPVDFSIYLNRVVENVADPADLARTGGERFYIVRQRDKTPVPDVSPLAPKAGGPWEFFAATPVDNAMWYAFKAKQ